MDTITQNKLISYIFDEWKVLLIFVAIYSIYYYGTYNYDYFKKKGISYIKPVIFFGSVWKRVTKQISYQDYQLYVYNYFKEKKKPYGGKIIKKKGYLCCLSLLNCNLYT